jgi:hypothetical protein
MERIGAAQARAVEDRAGAAADLAALWDEIGGVRADPLHAVSLAHFLADLQDDPAAELEWDQRALRAADSLTDERAREYHSSLAVRGFYPSLHLNLAADHVKLGDLDSARHHLALAEAAAPDLPPGGYGEMITGGIVRLRRELDGPGHNREAAAGSGT